MAGGEADDLVALAHGMGGAKKRMVVTDETSLAIWSGAELGANGGV
jgi:hypothetical protein